MEQYYFAVRVKEDIKSIWNSKNKRETEVSCVVVWARVGKEFSDRKQDERKIKFIRVEDAVRMLASSRENRRRTGVLGPFL